MDLYYIIQDEQKTGPFDLVSMITKIKNGRLSAGDLVLTEGSEEAVRANEIKVFHEYFMEIEYTAPHDHAPDAITVVKQSASSALLAKVEAFFSERHNAIAVAVGVFMFFLILLIGYVS